MLFGLRWPDKVLDRNKREGMVMRIRIIVFMVLFLIAGCAGVPSVLEPVRDDYTIDEMTGNILAGTPPWGTTYVELNVERYTSRDGEILYTLVVDYSSDEWLFIRDGESLVLLVEGYRIGLKGKGSSGYRDIGYRGRINEKAWYGISFESLEMIANAKEVEARIIGSRHHVDKHFSEENFRYFREFVNKHGS